MRIFLTGGSGLLGRDVAAACARDRVIAPTHEALDVVDKRSVERSITEARPDAVIHCAALTNVDECERDPERAHQVNVLGTENVARACARVGARLVAVSTDYVFGRERGRPLVETDEPDPISSYGRTKRAAEIAALAVCPDAIVARVSWLFDGSAAGFTGLISSRARRGDHVRAPADQRSIPTSSRVAARGLRRLVELTPDLLPGRTVHLVCSGSASRLEWARAIIDALGLPCTVHAASAAEFPGAPRPADSRLDNGRAHGLGIDLPHWRSELRALLRP